MRHRADAALAVLLLAAVAASLLLAVPGASTGEAEANEPIVMARAPARRGDGATARSVRISAEVAALTATPASSMRVGEGPSGPRAIHQTTVVAQAAPAIAAAGTRPRAAIGSSA